MLRRLQDFFKPQTQITVEKLNALTNPYTGYQWTYTPKDEYTEKPGFYLSLAKSTLDGDALLDVLGEIFKSQELKTRRIGNGLNAKHGIRLIIESNVITPEQIEKAKNGLNYVYGDGDKNTYKKIQHTYNG